MTEDTDVIEAIWSGSIPTCFKLASHECISPQNPAPFFLMLPRISYLPFVWEKVQRNFARFVSEESRSLPIWLEYNMTPLRWQNPIGLLFDLLAKDSELPWTLTVHFSDFPEGEVAEAQFMNALKEADFLKTSKKVMTAMTSSERRQIAGALHSLRRENFWTVNRKLMFTGEPWKHVPLRIIIAGTNKKIQKLVGISNAENEPANLREVLKDWVNDFSEEKHEAILHGVPAPLDSPLQWLGVNMSYADNFLYIVIRNR